jgi:hypothetical protein
MSDFDLNKEMQELIESFDDQAVRIIGVGKRKFTEVSEYADQEERKYMAKYGLDRNGEPLEVGDVMTHREGDGYKMTMDEGCELLSDTDNEQERLDEAMSLISPSGFNE